MKNYTFYIDVFSYCNLRCPSCIVGNKFGTQGDWPRGLMSAEFLDEILEKAQSECNIDFVGLYNWTEPLLNPGIVELIKVVKSRGLVCGISSNLNKLPDPGPLLAAQPNFFRVSVSGFTQPIYEIGHRGGNIEQVKQNMRRLAAVKAAIGSTNLPTVEVFYHKYRHNLSELSLMQEFAEGLGFQFNSVWAQIFPVEKIISIAEGDPTDTDQTLLDTLALPLDAALAATSKSHKTTCSLLEDMVTLDISGNAMLCCGCSMDRGNVVGNFLEITLDEMQRRRREMPLCTKCLAFGIPDYFLGHPEFERIATEALSKASPT